MPVNMSYMTETCQRDLEPTEKFLVVPLSFDVLIVLEEGPLCAGGSEPLFDSTLDMGKIKA